MHQGWFLAFFTFMLAGVSVTTAQQILTPTGTTNLKLSIAASERRVGLYADYADQSAVLVLGSGARRFSDAQLLLPSTGSASPHFVSLESYRGQPVASGGGWVFVADHINGAGGGRLLEIKTGQWTSISTIPGVTSAAISGDRLALLGLEHSGSAVGSRVAVYDCRTRALLGMAQHPAFPAFVFLSFSGPDTALLVETATLQIQPYTIGGGTLKALPAVKLSGAEVADSVRRAQGSNLPSNSRPRYVTAHFPGHNGNQLFFLAPYKSADGLRLVEFDSNGMQVKAYRVLGESTDANRLLAAAPFLLAASPGSFSLLGWDGIVRKYQEVE